MGDTLSKITNNILNLVTSISLLLLVYSLFILRGIQPEGYTVNIYEQLPFHFYLTLLLCYLSACVLLLAYRKISAVLILLLVHITVLIIPYMLGYVSVGRGDEFSYIGLAGQSALSDLSGFSSLSPTGPLFVSALASDLRPGDIGTFLFFASFFFNHVYYRNVPFLSNFHEQGKTSLSSFSLLVHSLFRAFPDFNSSLLPDAFAWYLSTFLC